MYALRVAIDLSGYTPVMLGRSSPVKGPAALRRPR